MSLPITGPYVFNWQRGWPPGFTAQGTRSDYISRTWYRQKPPYDRPLNFVSDGVKGVWSVGQDRLPLARNPDAAYAWISNPGPSSSNAYNKAWSEFNEALRGNAQWVVTLLQYRQSHDALVKHLTDLYHVFRDIRRGHFGTLYKRFKPPPGFKMKGKTVADQILEWRFGWLPLMGDIHNSAEALARDLGDFTVIGKGRAKWQETAVYNTTDIVNFRETRTATVDQRYKLSADVRITNPNTLLWDSLGFTNPLTVAYEMVAFSFVLNYFINLEEFLRGLTPWMGLELRNSCTTHFTTVKCQLVGQPSPATHPFLPRLGRYVVNFEGWKLARTVGAISGPPLRLRDPWILQPGRAVNAVSLLLQQLAKRR